MGGEEAFSGKDEAISLGARSRDDTRGEGWRRRLLVKWFRFMELRSSGTLGR